MNTKVTYSEDENTAYFNGREFIATDEANTIIDDIDVCGHCDLYHSCSSSFSSFMCISEDRLDGKSIFWVEKEKPAKVVDTKIIKIVQFKTLDGKTFDTEQQAIAHQAKMEFIENFNVSDYNWVMIHRDAIQKLLDATKE